MEVLAVIGERFVEPPALALDLGPEFFDFSDQTIEGSLGLGERPAPARC